MIEEFKGLTKEEQDLLYKASVLVSVFASCSFNEVNKVRKADAIKLAHLKTFTATPLLIPYYMEVEKNFEAQFNVIIQKYFPFDEEKKHALKKEMHHVSQVITKLDKTFADTFHKSLEGYAKHVRNASHSILQDFIFPMPIPGLG